jgi:hypothetical protein
MMVGSRPVVNLKFDGSALGFFGRALLAALCSLLIIPAAWGAIPLARWFVERIRFSDGTQARFVGRPAEVWWLYSLLALVSLAPSVIVRGDPDSQTLSWGLRFGVTILTAIITVPLLRWYAVNTRVGNTADLRFEGSYLGMIGYSLLIQVSFITIIGWAWALTAYQRWVMRQIKSNDLEFSFVGSGLGILWRGFVAALSCIFIIPIPWIMRWLANWYIENTVITRLTVPMSTGDFDSPRLFTGGPATAAAPFAVAAQGNQVGAVAPFAVPAQNNHPGVGVPFATPSKEDQAGAGMQYAAPVNAEPPRSFGATAPEEAYNRGVALFGAGRLAEARAVFDACIQQGVYVPEAAFARARCSIGLGQPVQIPPQLTDPEMAGVQAVATNLACYLIAQGFQARTAQHPGFVAVSATRGGPIHHISVMSVRGQYVTNVEREQGGRHISLADAPPLDQTELDRWFVRLCSSDLNQLPLSPLPPGGLTMASGPA